MQPLVSFVVPMRNERANPRLEATLASIVGQTWPRLEIVVVDDGSSDGTAKRVEEVLAAGSRPWRVLSEPENRGVARAINRGILASRGDYVARLDAGDTATPDRIERQIELLHADPRVTLCGSLAEWVDGRGRVLGPFLPAARRPADPDAVAAAMIRRNWLPDPTRLFRRRFFEDAGLYDPRHPCEEYDLAMRALARGHRLAVHPRVLTRVLFRREGLMVSRARAMQLDRFRIRLRYVRSRFSVTGMLTTLRSLLGVLVPETVFRRIV